MDRIHFQRGREDREKFGYKDGRLNPFCSKTNRERQKKKNFMMIKHKMKAKVKRSFKDKQVSYGNFSFLNYPTKSLRRDESFLRKILIRRNTCPVISNVKIPEVC